MCSSARGACADLQRGIVVTMVERHYVACTMVGGHYGGKVGLASHHQHALLCQQQQQTRGTGKLFWVPCDKYMYCQLIRLSPMIACTTVHLPLAVYQLHVQGPDASHFLGWFCSQAVHQVAMS
jgi:hypothetical protein